MLASNSSQLGQKRSILGHEPHACALWQPLSPRGEKVMLTCLWCKVQPHQLPGADKRHVSRCSEDPVKRDCRGHVAVAVKRDVMSVVIMMISLLAQESVAPWASNKGWREQSCEGMWKGPRQGPWLTGLTVTMRLPRDRISHATLVSIDCTPGC